jgi:tripartite-type tricarboxylate transporter receptor subunit TctC
MSMMRALPGWTIRYLTAVLICAFAAHPATAQDWPMRQPIKVVAPASAGSTSDIMARIVFEQVGHQLGQSVVVENRGGAGTTTGMAAVAKSAPDGYTILVNSTSYVVVASTYAKLPYDPYEDMTGLALLAHFPFVVATSQKYKTLAELVAAGRMQPSPVVCGSLGLGSSGHLAIARLLHAANFQATIVPFRGAPEVVGELAAGRIDMYAGVLPNVLELARAGQVNLVAMQSPRRSALVLDVPTTIEAAYPGSDYNFWMGSYLPAKTPRPIIERLNAEVAKALQDESARRRGRDHAGRRVQRFHHEGARRQRGDREADKLSAAVAGSSWPGLSRPSTSWPSRKTCMLRRRHVYAVGASRSRGGALLRHPGPASPRIAQAQSGLRPVRRTIQSSNTAENGTRLKPAGVASPSCATRGRALVGCAVASLLQS